MATYPGWFSHLFIYTLYLSLIVSKHCVAGCIWCSLIGEISLWLFTNIVRMDGVRLLVNCVCPKVFPYTCCWRSLLLAYVTIWCLKSLKSVNVIFWCTAWVLYIYTITWVSFRDWINLDLPVAHGKISLHRVPGSITLQVLQHVWCSVHVFTTCMVFCTCVYNMLAVMYMCLQHVGCSVHVFTTCMVFCTCVYNMHGVQYMCLQHLGCSVHVFTICMVFCTCVYNMLADHLPELLMYGLKLFVTGT